MCLITNWILPRLTLKPIVCYKLVVVTNDNKLAGINQKNYIYNRNEINKCSLYPIRGKKAQKSFYFYKQVIEGGYFHFFDNYNCYNILWYIQAAKAFNYHIIIKKCIIPRFTLYYKGIYDDIAAKRFKFIN